MWFDLRDFNFLSEVSKKGEQFWKKLYSFGINFGFAIVDLEAKREY